MGSLASAISEAARTSPWLDDLARQAASLPGESKNARLRRVRQKMLAADPHCWYCGTEVVEAGHHQRRSWEPKTSVPANAATIEHKFHRLKGDRPALGALVLACGECNNERNRYSQQLAGVDHLRRRARQHPCACGCGELARSDFAYKRGHGDDTLRVVS